MNEPLTRSEMGFILFSFKKTLRDRAGLTPDMIDFYEKGMKTLSESMNNMTKEDRDDF